MPVSELGNIYIKFGRYEEALSKYDQALILNQQSAEAWLGRGLVLSKFQRFDDALSHFDKVLALKPATAEAWQARASVLEQISRMAPEEAQQAASRTQAIEAYRQALKFGGESETIHYYLAALGVEATPAVPPSRYIADLFDHFADKFDHELIHKLKYQSPAILGDAIKRSVSSKTSRHLGLGLRHGAHGGANPLAGTNTYGRRYFRKHDNKSAATCDL